MEKKLLIFAIVLLGPQFVIFIVLRNKRRPVDCIFCSIGALTLADSAIKTNTEEMDSFCQKRNDRKK